jgi:hypothetical protein
MIDDDESEDARNADDIETPSFELSWTLPRSQENFGLAVIWGQVRQLSLLRFKNGFSTGGVNS